MKPQFLADITACVLVEKDAAHNPTATVEKEHREFAVMKTVMLLTTAEPESKLNVKLNATSLLLLSPAVTATGCPSASVEEIKMVILSTADRKL